MDPSMISRVRILSGQSSQWFRRKDLGKKLQSRHYMGFYCGAKQGEVKAPPSDPRVIYILWPPRMHPQSARRLQLLV